MKRIKLIYNSNSGNHSFSSKIDGCLEVLQKGGYEVSLFKIMGQGDIENHLKNIDTDIYDAFIIAGGDGTINIMVNAIMKLGLQNKPLGVIPSGTANDFATFMELPKDPVECCRIICQRNIKEIDLGKVNDRYFINVCAGGLFANVSSDVDKEVKNTLGKLAYYIEGLGRIPNFTPINMKITNSDEVIEDRLNLFLVLNSSGTGGIVNLSPDAKIDDGKLDFIGFRGKTLARFTSVLVKYFKGEGEYLEDDKIIFFRDKYIKVEYLSDEKEKFSRTDLDGEEGPKVPVEIINVNKAIKIFY